MRLDGKHTLNADQATVWKMLMDPDVLARATPGVQKLESTGNDTYNAVFAVKMGPVNGDFKGKMSVVDKTEPSEFTLKMNMVGKIGTVNATGKLTLVAVNARQTEVVFSGDAKLTGVLARTGQRVLNGVAKTMTQQFFESLQAELEGAAAKRGGLRMFFHRLWETIKNIFSKQ